jgi:hypothetical protein
MWPDSNCRRPGLHQRGPPEAAGVLDYTNAARVELSASSIPLMRLASSCQVVDYTDPGGLELSASSITPMRLLGASVCPVTPCDRCQLEAGEWRRGSARIKDMKEEEVPPRPVNRP